METKKFTRVMKALSDPNRVTILKILARRHLCVCELTALLGLAQSTVSKHLRILEEAGLVAYEKDGPWINYYLADGSDSLYAATLLGQLETWLEEDPRIRKILTGLAQVDRRRLCSGLAPPPRTRG
ncbi:ArsR/SmtB family transcription factor [Desulfurivibrio sp. C05AmB]|uniref:ArsR/SmtB family transcription factor n=1 Tax=Desulfurivibrio sp. C05AmB TaxID=3374371 RepID=UPI00376F1DEE